MGGSRRGHVNASAGGAARVQIELEVLRGVQALQQTLLQGLKSFGRKRAIDLAPRHLTFRSSVLDDVAVVRCPSSVSTGREHQRPITRQPTLSARDRNVTELDRSQVRQALI